MEWEDGMADILYEFPVAASAARVFAALSTAEGLDAWWTLAAVVGDGYELGFGAGYEWRAEVVERKEGVAFVLRMTVADDDWRGTLVGFRLEEREGVTWVGFSHTGWPEANRHYRVSAFCWAMYLRLLKRYCETGEVMGYAGRLGA